MLSAFVVSVVKMTLVAGGNSIDIDQYKEIDSPEFPVQRGLSADKRP
jgi:hypothetical protein